MKITPSRAGTQLTYRNHPTRSVFRTGPFLVSLDSSYPPAVQLHAELYPGSEESPDGQIVDFHVSLRQPLSPRRWIDPYIRFYSDGVSPFAPYPLDHAFPLLEWGLNWCIATQAHQYLMLHAAVVERNGNALILPALPGSGKSTLCAALAMRGWRMLSDEFGLVRRYSCDILPLPRAIPLKNQSIGVIRKFAPDSHLGPLFTKTRKGTVAHMRPPEDSLERQSEPATAHWLVFPRYDPQRDLRLKPIEKSLAFIRLSNNAFNYRLLGATGFHTLATIVRNCDCFALEYSNLDDMISAFDESFPR